MKPHIFLVDDDDSVREIMTFNLEDAGYNVTPFSDATNALNAYSADVDVVLTDVRMPRMDGLTLLQQLHHTDPNAVVVLMTAYGGTQRAVDAMREGAFHYVEKPVNTPTLLKTLQRAVEQRRSLRPSTAHHTTSPKPPPTQRTSTIIASSPKMNAVLRTVDKIASTPATILIRGESGTGKELIARAIHDRSQRSRRPFVPVNCAAIPPDLLESTLFGHVKGAFTGANRATEGKFRQAHLGTIFLDEIAELPPHLQSKLLRVLQEGEVEIVGGNPIRVDTRVIAATHQNLEALLAQGTLRQDLYYRLNVVPIHIPPLRERPEDIPALTRAFIRRLEPSTPIHLTQDADDLLIAYPWPGNVRELQNIVERAVWLRESNTLDARDLPEHVRTFASTPSHTLPFSLPPHELDLLAFEKTLIQAVLHHVQGNQSAAARYLKIPRHVLLYRLEKYGLKPDT